MNSTSSYYPHSQIERLIAAGRITLSAFFLLAVWLDPSEPSRYAELAYSLLSVYVVYSFFLGILTWRNTLNRSFLPIVTHSVDMLVFAFLIFLTEGPSSPFFVYFIFLIVCATLRWQWRGTLWTAIASLTVVVTLAWYYVTLLDAHHFEVNRFIIRIVYLAVVATLLGYLGAYEQSMRSMLSMLSQWPRSAPGELQAMLNEMLQHGATILRVPRIILVWEEEDEPWLHLALWSHGNLECTREHPEAFGGLVAEPLAELSFFCCNAGGMQTSIVRKSSAGLQKWQGAPLQRQLQEKFDIGALLAARLTGQHVSGYLFALDRETMTDDDLVLGEIVAHETAARLDNFLLMKRLQQTAISDERVRLARDLHDGLLQSMAGAALQLESAQRLVEAKPQSARQQILETQHLLAAEQRELRAHIGDLRLSHVYQRGDEYALTSRLEGLAVRIRQQWGLSVDISIVPSAYKIVGNIGREIYFVTHEALINAVRHSGPSTLQAALSFETDRVCITVTDNGHGFSFRGRYDLETLREMKRGPVTLKERITDLQGTLCIDSQETGSRLDITLPLSGHGD